MSETLGERIRALLVRREELRVELFEIERQLLDGGALLAVTVNTVGMVRTRGRSVNGDSVRARILAILSDGAQWRGRDIVRRIDAKPESVSAQLSRMAAEGDILRVRQGHYTAQQALPAEAREQ